MLHILKIAGIVLVSAFALFCHVMYTLDRIRQRNERK